MSVIFPSVRSIKQYLLRMVVIMGSCVLAAVTIKIFFDIDLHHEIIFGGVISILVSSSKKKYVPNKQ